MDKEHQMDAPDNESLKTIEQIGDRSALTDIYPHSKDEWEGTNVMSQYEREQKRDDEQLQITMTIRRWFAVVGFLVPVPFVVFAVIASLATTYLFNQKVNLALWAIPVIAVVLIGIIISYKATKGVADIFYKHAIKASPFVITLITLVALSVYGLFLVTQYFHNGELLHDVLITSGAAILTSIMYSGILLMIWASPTFRSAYKVLVILGLVALIATLTVAAIYMI